MRIGIGDFRYFKFHCTRGGLSSGPFLFDVLDTDGGLDNSGGNFEKLHVIDVKRFLFDTFRRELPNSENSEHDVKLMRLDDNQQVVEVHANDNELIKNVFGEDKGMTEADPFIFTVEGMVWSEPDIPTEVTRDANDA